MLTRDSFNQAKSKRNRAIPCSVDGVEDFFVLEFIIPERNEFDSKAAAIKETFNTPEYVLALSKLILLHCLCKEDGSRLLKEEDVEDIDELPAVYNLVIQECMRINYMFISQHDEVKKKSSRR